MESIVDELRNILKQGFTDLGKRDFVLRPEILTCHNIPQPMHGTAPRVVLGDKWWNKTRKEAYKSTNYHCLACGVQKYQAKNRQWLEGHELYDIDYMAGRMVYVETVPLCHYCHNYIHDGRLRWLLETGQLHQSKYVAIIQHGDAILREHGLRRDVYLGPVAEWEEWRLVIGDMEFKPFYPTEEDWLKQANGHLPEE